MTPAAFATVSVLALLALAGFALWMAVMLNPLSLDRPPRLTRGDVVIAIILIIALWFSAYATVGGFA